MFPRLAASLFATAAASLAILAAPPARAGDWPQFRGPTGQGLSDAKNVPTEWSPTRNVVWTTPIPGQGWSSPVLLNGKLYLTTAVTENNGRVSLGALCIDASDGKV